MHRELLYLCLYIALSVPQGCAELVDVGRKQELLPQTSVHISDDRVGDVVPMGDSRALHPRGYSEREKAGKLTA